MITWKKYSAKKLLMLIEMKCLGKLNGKKNKNKNKNKKNKIIKKRRLKIKLNKINLIELNFNHYYLI